jgi:hypothetical protein
MRTAGAPATGAEQDNGRAARATDPRRLRVVEGHKRGTAPHAGRTSQPGTAAFAVPGDVVALSARIVQLVTERRETTSRFRHDLYRHRRGSPAGAPDRLIAQPPRHRARRKTQRRQNHHKRKVCQDICRSIPVSITVIGAEEKQECKTGDPGQAARRRPQCHGPHALPFVSQLRPSQPPGIPTTTPRPVVLPHHRSIRARTSSISAEAPQPARRRRPSAAVAARPVGRLRGARARSRSGAGCGTA